MFHMWSWSLVTFVYLIAQSCCYSRWPNPCSFWFTNKKKTKCFFYRNIFIHFEKSHKQGLFFNDIKLCGTKLFMDVARFLWAPDDRWRFSSISSVLNLFVSPIGWSFNPTHNYRQNSWMIIQLLFSQHGNTVPRNIGGAFVSGESFRWFNPQVQVQDAW